MTMEEDEEADGGMRKMMGKLRRMRKNIMMKKD